MTVDTAVAEGKENNGIELIPGHSNILLVAPHGHYLDDENTGKLTRIFAQQNGCYAIINEVYGRKADATHHINLNSLSEVKEHLQNEFLMPLLEYKNEIVQEHDNAWVFWIHGAKEKSIENDIQAKADVNPKEIKVLVGYGQKKDDNRLTAEPETAARLIDALTQNGLDAVAANSDIPKGTRSFCAHDLNNMNQLFSDGEYKDPTVKSFQLEFRKIGCRDTEENIEETARMLSLAISALVPADDKNHDKTAVIEDPVVLKAYDKLALVFSKNYEQALMEAGQYIVRTFYGDEKDIEDEPYDEELMFDDEVIQRAREKDSPKEKTLNQLYKKIDESGTSNMPSKAWIYNAVNLVVQWQEVKTELEDCFHTYRSLLLSHKVLLLKVKELTIKQQLIEEADKNKFTVILFKKRLAELLPEPENKPISLPALLKNPEFLVKEESSSRIALTALKKQRIKTLNNLKNVADEQFQTVESDIKALGKRLEEHKQYLEKYTKVKATIEKAIKFKEGEPKKKPTKRKAKKVSGKK